jgi:hypothetical protein
MTDKQQPPERIWLDSVDCCRDDLGSGSYYTGKPSIASIPYARVRSVDDGRVEEIDHLRRRQDLRKRLFASGASFDIAVALGDLDTALSLLLQLSSSEHRCGECGHVDAIDPHGRCMSVYYDAGGSLVYCGCKCVFPASTKETVEQFERDFAAWQRKMNESIEATRQSEILTAEDFNIRINARAKQSG